MSVAWLLLSDLSSVPIKTFQAEAVVLGDEPRQDDGVSMNSLHVTLDSAFHLVSGGVSELFVGLVPNILSSATPGLMLISILIPPAASYLIGGFSEYRCNENCLKRINFSPVES
ncbi:uncharacterized [Tachysurus ichikawai]